MISRGVCSLYSETLYASPLTHDSTALWSGRDINNKFLHSTYFISFCYLDIGRKITSQMMSPVCVTCVIESLIGALAPAPEEKLPSVHYFCMDNLIKCQKNYTISFEFWIQIMVYKIIYVLCRLGKLRIVLLFKNHQWQLICWSWG